jgi:hypothetical protein
VIAVKMIGMERCVVLCIWSLLACGSAGHVKGPVSKIQQAPPNGNFGIDNSERKTMTFELLAASDNSTTAPTITSASSHSSASTSSRSGKKGKKSKGASVESPSSDFYPHTKGKKGDSYEKSGKKKKSKGTSKSKIKNSKKSKKSSSKKGEETMTPTSPSVHRK